jgi:hypothetical protein
MATFNNLFDSVERCHSRVYPEGCIVFCVEALLVLAIEVENAENPFALAGVITTTVIQEHRLIPHILLFVGHEELPVDASGGKLRKQVQESFTAGVLDWTQAVFNVNV